MAQAHAEASATVGASPEVVYGIISDYEHGHPRILPEANFRDLRVEEGGVGAGTVISFVARIGGGERTFRGRVEEPEPGRVLVERYFDSNTVTTFTVTPEGNGRSQVKITTDWTVAPGLRGQVEKMLAPGALRKVYEAELRKLNEVAVGEAARV
jgi:hypothetical protein